MSDGVPQRVPAPRTPRPRALGPAGPTIATRRPAGSPRPRRGSLARGLTAGVVLVAAASAQIRPVHPLHPGAVPPERPMLWELEAESGDTSYLFGTLAVADGGRTALPAEVGDALRRVDVVHGDAVEPEERGRPGTPAEAGTGEPAAGLADAAARPLDRGGPIEAALRDRPSDEWAEPSRLGWLGLAPPAAGPQGLDEAQRDLALDELLRRSAREAGKPLVALHAAAGEPAASLDAADLRRLRAAFGERIAELGAVGEDWRERLACAYRSGEPARFAAVLRDLLGHDPELAARGFDALVTEPNRRLAEGILAELRDHPERRHLFAVGAEHLAGEHGVLELLEAHGYTLRRLGPPVEVRSDHPGPYPTRDTLPGFEPYDWGRI